MDTPQPKRYELRRSRLGARQGRLLKTIAIYAVLIIVAILIIMPLVWMLSTSLKPKSQWFAKELAWIPKTVTTDNYSKLLGNPQVPILRWFFNSVLVSTVTTLLNTHLASRT